MGHQKSEHLWAEYSKNPDNLSVENHSLTLHHQDKGPIGYMSWSNDDNLGMLQDIHIEPSHQRKGLGTKLWQTAHELAQQDPNITPPTPSNFRTLAGDQWAWKLHANKLSEEPPQNEMDEHDMDERHSEEYGD